MSIYYVDGKFVSSQKAVIPVDDLAVLRGYGICDIMRTYRGKPYFLDEHIKRLEQSAASTGIVLPWGKNTIRSIILETLEKNMDWIIKPGHRADDGACMNEANIRIVITGGSSPDFFTPSGNPRLIVLVTPMKKLPDEWYTEGVKVITIEQERAIPDAKITSYIPAALALQKARKNNAVEAIYVNGADEVLEGTTSNLFAFFGSKLITPAHGVLKGITRKLILSLASEMFWVEEKQISRKELLDADEVFITGTNKGVVPVIQVDNSTIGNGKPGKHTLEIIKALNRHAMKFKES